MACFSAPPLPGVIIVPWKDYGLWNVALNMMLIYKDGGLNEDQLPTA
jgi:hypothetical protein